MSRQDFDRLNHLLDNQSRLVSINSTRRVSINSTRRVSINSTRRVSTGSTQRLSAWKPFTPKGYSG